MISVLRRVQSRILHLQCLREDFSLAVIRNGGVGGGKEKEADNKVIDT